jgi:hypothetical protein
MYNENQNLKMKKYELDWMEEPSTIQFDTITLEYEKLLFISYQMPDARCQIPLVYQKITSSSLNFQSFSKQTQ